MSMNEDHPDDAPTIFGKDVRTWTSPPGRFLVCAHHRIAHRSSAGTASTLGLVAGGVVVAVSTAAAITVYDDVTGRFGVQRLDAPALRLGKRLRSPAANTAAGTIARLFGPIGMPLLTLGAGSALALRRRRAEPLGFVTAAGAGSLAMTLLGKQLIHRNRPPHRDAAPPYEHSPSFPSGHTINAASVMSVLAYLIILRQRRRRGEVAVAVGAGATIAAVGASRVLLGAHWFTDVAMGWTAGFGWATAVITTHRLHLTAAHRRTQANCEDQHRTTPIT
ncbi:phosphatase PAP2 family protein [Curtobacterium sp. ME12]|uniref:phosphatase PAP2 family protein n=1 Tax=Curtobacterium sp. ME12 TaxID=2744253 RepID=UPI0015F5BC32|nr:phosphatase PAP2 family protein [Curtobacterium sp. ME12]